MDFSHNHFVLFNLYTNVNWTLEVVLNILSSFPYFVVSIVLISHLIHYRDNIILGLTITWFSYGIFWLLNGLSYLFLSSTLFRYNKIFLVISTCALIYSFDQMHYDKIEPLKLSLISILCSGLLYFVTLPNAVSYIELANGDPSLQNTGNNRIIISILSMFIIILYFYHSILLQRTTPRSLKKYSLIHLIGAILFGPVTLILFLFEISFFPGFIPVISALGVVLLIIPYAKSPNLIYTLTFDVYRLIVIEADSGMNIFNHSWLLEDNEYSEHLFTSSFEAISSFTNEVLKLGKINEINLEFGYLMIEVVPNSNLYTVLLTSKSSSVLRSNLKSFAKLFRNQYSDQILSLSKVRMTSPFDDTGTIVKMAFPYIPDQ